MNEWHRFIHPTTDFGLASLVLAFGAVGAAGLVAGEAHGTGAFVRFAWFLAGCVTVYQWWSVSDYLRARRNEEGGA